MAQITSDHVEWSPLQLSSFNLTKPGQLTTKPRPQLRTETLERYPVRHSGQMKTFTSGRSSAEPFSSGRNSAEPLDSYKMSGGLMTSNTGARARTQVECGMLVTPLPTSLSELDLR